MGLLKNNQRSCRVSAIPQGREVAVFAGKLVENPATFWYFESDGRRIQSLHFRFSYYRDTKLCVAYDGYQGVQFGDKYTTYWCRCN